MAWGSDINARHLGRRALVFYDGEPDSAQAAIAAAKQHKDAGRTKRQSTGFTPLTALGGPRGLSLVIATSVIATRRGPAHDR
jgi:hypothetical protein